MWRGLFSLDLIWASSTSWGLRDWRHGRSRTEQLADLLKCFPSFRDSCLGTNISAWRHGTREYRDTSVCEFTVFSEEWRRVNSGKRPVWRAVYCSGSSDEDWLTERRRSRRTESPAFTHTNSAVYDLMSLFWFCKTLQASSGEFSENLYFHPKQV